MTNQYITGAMIKRLREKKNLTQTQLAEKINVTDKAVSKWETGRGYPDISLVEPLAMALGVSVIDPSRTLWHDSKSAE
ncbi:MAG: helix-turn-helix transcriptional regulator [Treponema sp.]|nr:helix-turn-helix transcriptional regulator [Treponema sp.]